MVKTCIKSLIIDTSGHQKNIKAILKQKKTVQKHVFTYLSVTDVDLNLLSWSAASNMVALALYGSIYLWDAASGSITELCEIPSGSGDDYYSSVSFMPGTSDCILALGNSRGEVQVMTVI